MKLNIKYAIVSLLIIGAVIFAFIKYSRKVSINPSSLAQLDGVMEDGSGKDATVEVVPDVVPGEVKKVNDTTNTFTHNGYGFSLNYPSDMKTSNFIEGGGEQIIFQNETTKDWFQIYVTPWDEQGDITVARIKKDLPNLAIINPTTVIIGPQQKDGIGPKALMFLSKDTGFGDTREVWFVYSGNLYQVTTFKRLDSMIGQVLSTLTFK